jgi:hypothetical protein
MAFRTARRYRPFRASIPPSLFVMWTGGPGLGQYTSNSGRGLVQAPEQWRWSSFRSYAYGEAGAVKLNAWPRAELKIRPAA